MTEHEQRALTPEQQRIADAIPLRRRPTAAEEYATPGTKLAQLQERYDFVLAVCRDAQDFGSRYGWALHEIAQGKGDPVAIARAALLIEGPQPTFMAGLVWAVAYGDNQEISAMFDTPQQAHAFVEWLKKFIDVDGVPVPADQTKRTAGTDSPGGAP